jgi:hypothetical protein
MLMTPDKVGEVTLHLGWRGGFHQVTFGGGPYDAMLGPHNKRPGTYGVALCNGKICVGDADLHLALGDLGVPKSAAAVESAIFDVYHAAFRGEKVYVGCVGGYGGTGLFLALLAKTAGIEQPVVWTREHYDSTAVGTNKQAAYISGFDVAEVRYKVWWAAWLMRVGIELY